MKIDNGAYPAEAVIGYMKDGVRHCMIWSIPGSRSKKEAPERYWPHKANPTADSELLLISV